MSRLPELSRTLGRRPLSVYLRTEFGERSRNAQDAVMPRRESLSVVIVVIVFLTTLCSLGTERGTTKRTALVPLVEVDVLAACRASSWLAISPAPNEAGAVVCPSLLLLALSGTAPAQAIAERVGRVLTLAPAKQFEGAKSMGVTAVQQKPPTWRSLGRPCERMPGVPVRA